MIPQIRRRGSSSERVTGSIRAVIPITAAERPDPALGSCREGGQDHAYVWSRDRQAATGLPLALVKSLTDPLSPSRRDFRARRRGLQNRAALCYSIHRFGRNVHKGEIYVPPSTKRDGSEPKNDKTSTDAKTAGASPDKERPSVGHDTPPSPYGTRLVQNGLPQARLVSAPHTSMQRCPRFCPRQSTRHRGCRSEYP